MPKKESTRDKVKRLVLLGEWDRNIATKLGVTVQSVSLHRRELGLTANRPPKGVEVTTPTGITAEALEGFTKEFFKKYAPLDSVPKQIRTVQVKDMQIGEHEAVAVFSDYHYGSLIDPRVTGGLAEYNMAIARERLTKWRNAVLRFTQMMQVVAKVDKLHVFALGDDLEGHGDMFPTQKLQMGESIYFQAMEFAEDMTTVLMSFLSRYRKVYVHKVYGNHGRIAADSKGSYGPDNVELFAWHIIKERCERLAPGRFEFNISESFFIRLDIFGWSFYIRHGHKIKGIGNTYVSAQSNKLAMNSVVGEIINYMVKAHLHQSESMEAEIDGMVIQNGCFVGPSLYSVEGQKVSASRPSQELFFIHPKNGLTHRHTLHLADAKEMRRHLKVWGRK